MSIKHFSHDHPLELTRTSQVGPTSLCAACKKRPDSAVTATIPVSSNIFACCDCDYFLHMPCFHLPQLKNCPRPQTNMLHNRGPATSGTTGKDPRHNHNRKIVPSKKGKKWLKWLRVSFALFRLAHGDITSLIDILHALYGEKVVRLALRMVTVLFISAKKNRSLHCSVG